MNPERYAAGLWYAWKQLDLKWFLCPCKDGPRKHNGSTEMIFFLVQIDFSSARFCNESNPSLVFAHWHPPFSERIAFRRSERFF